MIESSLLTANAFALAAGLDRRGVAKRMAHIEPTVTGKLKRYPLSTLLRACVLDIAKLYLPDHVTAENESLDQARTRKESALASLHELDLAERTGKLLAEDDVANCWVAIVGNVKRRLLAIPTRAAPLVLGCKTLPQVNDVLKNLIYEALTELSSTNPLEPPGTFLVEDKIDSTQELRP